jgi:hypothetical protein
MMMDVTTRVNQRVETNRRHDDPFKMSREFNRCLCALPFLSAAVAHPRRSALQM